MKQPPPPLLSPPSTPRRSPPTTFQYFSPPFFPCGQFSGKKRGKAQPGLKKRERVEPQGSYILIGSRWRRGKRGHYPFSDVHFGNLPQLRSQRYIHLLVQISIAPLHCSLVFVIIHRIVSLMENTHRVPSIPHGSTTPIETGKV